MKNSYVVVTGAASGIGKQVAIQLAADGWQVVITDINEEGLQGTAREFGVAVACGVFGVQRRCAVHAGGAAL